MKPKHRRWPNGGGLVQDFVEIDSRAFVGEGARVSDEAEVMGVCRITGKSKVEDHAQIHGAAHITDSHLISNSLASGIVWLYKSVVSGNASLHDRAQGLHSMFLDSAVASGDVRASSSEMSGQSRLLERAHIFEVTMRDRSVVCGTAEVEGNITLDRHMRIHEGSWTRAPHYVDGRAVQMTECIEGRVIIGCQCHPVKWWKEHGYGMGRLYGWTREETAEYYELIKEFE
jgi:NDP-sugar pyrophosphorylase family protein